MEVDDILEQVDILEYISQYCDFEKKNGEYWTLSPFKEEKTPSFSVNTEKQRFYDFSSGIGGNLIHFIRKYNNCGFIEAVNILKKYAGITDDTTKSVGHLEATKIAKRFSIKASPIVKSNPTILPDNYMERYEKREDKLAIWKQEGISDESLDRFQVYYDSFSDRLVYPIRSADGKIVNIGGRTLDPQWKEKKYRKYTYFFSWGGSMNTIYGLFENLKYIQKAHEVIIFEGCKSVLMADTWGIKNCVAILTSHLSPNQFKLLVKLGCRIVFALDKDVNIKDDHNIERLKSYATIEYLKDTENLLDEKDSPVDKGFETFKRLYERRISVA